MRMIFSCVISIPDWPPTAFSSRFLAVSSIPISCGISSVTPCAPQTANAFSAPIPSKDSCHLSFRFHSAHNLRLLRQRILLCCAVGAGIRDYAIQKRQFFFSLTVQPFSEFVLIELPPTASPSNSTRVTGRLTTDCTWVSPRQYSRKRPAAPEKTRRRPAASPRQDGDKPSV